VSVSFSESEVELATLDWLESSGWTIRNGPKIALSELFAPDQNCDDAPEGM
jgi:hypothetical protein